MDTMKNMLPVLYIDDSGNLVFREGSSEWNDDWIKHCEGNTDEEAHKEALEIHRRRLAETPNSTNP